MKIIKKLFLLAALALALLVIYGRWQSGSLFTKEPTVTVSPDFYAAQAQPVEGAVYIIPAEQVTEE